MRITKKQVYFYCYMAFCFLLGGLMAGLPMPWSLVTLGIYVVASLGIYAWAYYKAGH